MHWLQTIRENLRLNQKELAYYLRLSAHMINSVEIDRRQLPADSVAPAVTLYQAIKDLLARDPVIDPTLGTDRSVRRMKRAYRQCRRSLELRTAKLEEMQRAHTNTCFCLAIYQAQAQSLTPPQNEADLHRLHWTEWRIEETMQRIRDNNAAARDLLAAEIAGLKSMMQALEGSRFFVDAWR